jgi:hypothetical protein
METFVEGEYAMCWYPKIQGEHELELYYCQIIGIGKEHATCRIFFGQRFDPSKVKGNFVSDVCVGDLLKVDKKQLLEDLKANLNRRPDDHLDFESLNEADIQTLKTLMVKAAKGQDYVTSGHIRNAIHATTKWLEVKAEKQKILTEAEEDLKNFIKKFDTN